MDIHGLYYTLVAASSVGLEKVIQFMNKAMPQENLKLISARIDPETLEKIDVIQHDLRYWKRNSIINGILTAVVDSFSKKEIYDMVCYTRRFDEIPSGFFQHNFSKKSK